MITLQRHHYFRARYLLLPTENHTEDKLRVGENTIKKAFSFVHTWLQLNYSLLIHWVYYMSMFWGQPFIISFVLSIKRKRNFNAWSFINKRAREKNEYVLYEDILTRNNKNFTALLFTKYWYSNFSTTKSFF